MKLLGGFGETWSVPPGHAARPECCVLSRAESRNYRRSLRPCLGTSSAPLRRATFRQTLLLLALAFALLGAGCAGGGEDDGAAARVYLLRDGKVWPLPRDVQEGADAARALAAELLRGPSEDERELGFLTALPDDLDLSGIAIVGDVAHVDLDRALSPEGLAQLVYTLTGLPGVRTVDLEGGATLVTGFGRDDFEEHTPAVLVETPLSGEEVASPLRVTGTANTFEANFQYELADADGRVLAENFVTATSGTGTRGTFEFTAPFELDGDGTLTVFESSAKDGSRINVAKIPLRMKQ